MVRWLRFLLFPFGMLYWIITYCRNLLYDYGILRSYIPPITTLAVGNLSVGGTGKTPMIEYLIRLLQEHYLIATLSRGYKRESKGFVLANNQTEVADLGDEPYQFYSKFKKCMVAVDANRSNGIKKLLAQSLPPQIILLDDAFQHRKVKAQSYILLTAYTDIYPDDYILPVGNLRESCIGADRASIIVVTKCPLFMEEFDKQYIIKKLKPHKNQKVFFTYIDYDCYIYNGNEKIAIADIRQLPKVIFAGIAKPEPFFNYLQASGDIILRYPDHHSFTSEEIQYLQKESKGKILITTEKDYVRLKDNYQGNNLYYLPIQTKFLADKELFDQMIFSSL